MPAILPDIMLSYNSSSNRWQHLFSFSKQAEVANVRLNIVHLNDDVQILVDLMMMVTMMTQTCRIVIGSFAR